MTFARVISVLTIKNRQFLFCEKGRSSISVCIYKYELVLYPKSWSISMIISRQSKHLSHPGVQKKHWIFEVEYTVNEFHSVYD